MEFLEKEDKRKQWIEGLESNAQSSSVVTVDGSGILFKIKESKVTSEYLVND